MEIDQLTPDEWRELSDSAHITCFSELRPAWMDRISYALIAKKGEQLCGYITARETDAETVYWQFGGAFPGTRKSARAVEAIEAAIEWTLARYKRITALVENVNLPMLKMALHCGFLIIGVENFHGTILVKLMLEGGE